MQYNLVLGNFVSYKEEDFVVFEDNSLIYNFLKSWPNWGKETYSNMLFLDGPESSGKTHLSSIWQVYSNAEYINLEKLKTTDMAYFFATKNSFIIDDLKTGFDEEFLFHFLNLLKENRSYLLINSRQKPQGLGIKLPDLKSRMVAIPNFSLEIPNDEAIELLLLKHFSDRQLKVNYDIINYIKNRIERTYFSVQKIVEEVDIYAMQHKRKISTNLINEVFSSNISSCTILPNCE